MAHSNTDDITAQSHSLFVCSREKRLSKGPSNSMALQQRFSPNSVFQFPGAFLIPYFLCLAIAGIPIFFIELGIGQRLRRGSVACWNEISPYLGGIGIACMLVSFFVSVYYNMIIGWSFYYMFISMQEKLPYETCDGFDDRSLGKRIRSIAMSKNIASI